MPPTHPSSAFLGELTARLLPTEVISTWRDHKPELGFLLLSDTAFDSRTDGTAPASPLQPLAALPLPTVRAELAFLAKVVSAVAARARALEAQLPEASADELEADQGAARENLLGELQCVLHDHLEPAAGALEALALEQS